MVITIVGGGASGAIAATALLRHESSRARDVIVVEPATDVGLGVAYATPSMFHILNVRAKAMSAVADEPASFVDWANANGTAALGPEFLPRPLYGRYIRDMLATAAATAQPGVRFEHRATRVSAVSEATDGRFLLNMDDGNDVLADLVVLAMGNVFATPRWLPQDARVIADPWQPGVIEGLRERRDIIVAGTGLTAVDVILTLRAAGFSGVAHMVSTHGLIPAPHIEEELRARSPAARTGEDAAQTARGLLCAMREDAAAADDWRQTIDGIRPMAVDLWRNLPAAEQRRLVRHVAARWSVLRHRMAPVVAAALAELSAQGQLTIEHGRVVGADTANGDSLSVTIAHGGVREARHTDALVWCAGPTTDPAADPLLAGMLEASLVARHPLGIGLDVEFDGRAKDSDGLAWPNLWTIGPLRKGSDWETLAVPEIRGQAHALAQRILAD